MTQKELQTFIMAYTEKTPFFAIQLQHEPWWGTHTQREYEGSNTLLALLLGDNNILHISRTVSYIFYTYSILYRPAVRLRRAPLPTWIAWADEHEARAQPALGAATPGRGKLILMHALLAGSTRLCESGMCPPRHQNRMIGIILIPVEIKDWKT
jgi:hypothetical protein